MTPEEQDLRRALAVRSGEVSPEFRSRLAGSLEQGRPGGSSMQAIALVTVVALSLASIGILVLARNATRITHGGPASTPRLTSPLPSPTAADGQVFLPQTAVISAPSGNVVWVYFAQGFLFRSVDRGDTWEQRSLPPIPAAAWPEISFVDSQNGWYSTSGSPETQCNAQQAAIWHTGDGGSTWQSLSTTGISDSQCKEGLSFVDSTHGFLAAWDDNHRPTIYRTSDGGRTWSGATLPDPPGFVTLGAGIALRAGLVKRFGSTLLVSAFGNEGPPYVFRSTDGGATWIAIARGTLAREDIALTTSSRWLQIVPADQTVETTDSGKTWHPFTSDYSQAAPVAPVTVFGDSVVGYATVRGSIQRTADGGAHWVIIKTPGT
jgi:photosystem II stability/assembly factor-like uncharacterized protein